MRAGRGSWWLIGVALALGAACGGSDNGDTSGAGDPTEAGTVSFGQQVHPLLVAKCGSCHGTAWGSTNASTSYQAARLKVETSTPTNSDLYERGTGQAGHDKVLTDQEAELLLRWIQLGAKND